MMHSPINIRFIVAVSDLVKNDRRISSRMVPESLNNPKNVVLRILKDYMGKRKLFARFVPHSLTPEQRDDRVTSCHLQEFLNPEDVTDSVSKRR